MTRLIYLASHPIQYQAPLLRRIAAAPGIDLRVLFERDPQADGAFDPGFGREVAWDVPLRDGYDNALLRDVDVERELASADALWMHGWQSPVFRRILAQAKRRGLPVLMRGENCELAMPDGAGPRGVLKRLYLRRIFSRCAAFLAIGTVNAQYYRARGIDPRRIFSVPYAVDNAFFAERAQAARPDLPALRQALGIGADRKVVLYSGKLSQRKNPHVLLEAWRRAVWPGERPVLLFVGDGELRDGIAAAPESDVVFAGFRNQTELPAFYALCDVFVLASYAEPWGLAVNEAMACGRAVIVSDQCGCAVDLVDDSVGAVVAAGDVDALAQALPRVVEECQARGAAAAQRMAGWDFGADLAGLTQALAALPDLKS